MRASTGRGVTRLARRVAPGVCALAGALCAAAASDAQETRPAPLAWGVELTGTYASRDPGYFDYVDYGRDYPRNALRLAVASGSARLRLGGRAALLAELRAENDTARVHALYLRLTPWPGQAVDVQLGRIPPVFGAFARRRYGSDNPLIGAPLAYQYLTALRPDAAPSRVSRLRQSQGAGWWPYHDTGSAERRPGLPLVNGWLWDTGVEARFGERPVALAVSLTRGTLSGPRVRDDNGGLQVAGRLAVRPSVGWELGASFARGEYVDDSLREVLPGAVAEAPGNQAALGLDGEWSAGPWLVRGELVHSRWDVPGTRGLDGPVRATAIMLEARVRVAPGLSLAARADHLGFSQVRDADGAFPWDAPVTRLELGIGCVPRRHVMLKAGYQYDWRDGGRERETGIVAGQVVVWF